MLILRDWQNWLMMPASFVKTKKQVKNALQRENASDYSEADKYV